jgi:thiamine-monophosphate kinase
VTTREASIIAQIVGATQRVGRPPRLGPGDDAAITRRGEVVTVDALVEGVHWDDRLTAADVGYKALAVSVSDLAAMGARPCWAVLSLSLPGARVGWVAAFAEGLAAAARRWSVAIIGGDTTGSPGPIVVSLTAGGALVGPPLRRSGGRPGDDLWVTGALGLAGAGWRSANPSPAALAALRRPDPPVGFALALARAGLATAAMDLSDGLAADLPRLTTASGVGATLDPGALPGADGLGADALDHQLRGGEDYQLLFSAAPRHRATLRGLAAACGIPLSRIGVLTSKPGLSLGISPWPAPAFDHFVAADAAHAGLAGADQRIMPGVAR